jgi:hypothetical protein
VSDVHYCHLCFKWVCGCSEWVLHCQDHIEALIPKKCGTITYCYTLVRPGYCPFCLGNGALPATARFTSWIRDHKLWQHVSNHVQRCSWPTSCPHPSCDALLDTEPSLRFHFIDDHGFSRTWPGRARSDLVSVGESDKEEDGVQERKKWKSKPADHKDTSQWMPSAPSQTARPLERSRSATATVSPSLIFDSGCAGESLAAAALSSPVDLDSTYHGYWSDDDSLVCRSEASLQPLSDVSSVDADNDGDGVFSQFIRSPSPNCPSWPSGDHTYQVATQNAKITASTSAPSSETGCSTQHQQKPQVSGPRIRLRVGPPKKITLHLPGRKAKHSHTQTRPRATRSPAH